MAKDDFEKPPLFNSWKGWYTTVLIILASLVILFYLATRIFS